MRITQISVPLERVTICRNCVSGPIMAVAAEPAFARLRHQSKSNQCSKVVWIGIFMLPLHMVFAKLPVFVFKGYIN